MEKRYFFNSSKKRGADKKIRVLITGAGTATTQSVIKGLRQQKEFDVYLIGVDMQENAAGRYLCDKFYLVPGASSPFFLKELLRICKKEKVDLLIPIIDYEFEKLAKNANKFEEIGCKAVISSPETIEICNNKFKTEKFFIRNNLLTAKSYSKKEIKNTRIKFPLFVKPAILGRATIDAYKANNKRELLYYLAKVKNPIIQEFIEGEEYTIDVLSNFEGRAIAAIPRKRIETKGGLSYKGLIVKDSQMIRKGKLIAERTGIIGPCNIQCFKNKKGELFFSEINPRFSGALVLTIASGFNAPLALIKLFLGEKIKFNINKIKNNLLMLRYWEEIFVEPKKNKILKKDYRLL